MVRVQTARARAGEVLAGAPLDDRHVDPRQRELARQHQPGRTSSGDHHRMLGHGHISDSLFRSLDPARNHAALPGAPA